MKTIKEKGLQIFVQLINNPQFTINKSIKIIKKLGHSMKMAKSSIRCSNKKM